MPKIALPAVACDAGTPHPILGAGPGPTSYQLMSDPGGLTQFGAFLEELPPGSSDLVIGTRARRGIMHYTDHDLVTKKDDEVRRYLHRDGPPYPPGGKHA